MKKPQLIPKNTVLEFQFLADKIATYITAIPINNNGDLESYEISFFHEGNDFLLSTDTYGALSEMYKVFEINRISGKMNRDNIFRAKRNEYPK